MPKVKDTSKTKDNERSKAIGADLSYNEAHTALQLTLSALQATDLDVEAMTGLYRQARAYLDRCEEILANVEQEVMLWQGGDVEVFPINDLT
ncbi:MAG: exodeoxyribonuclease VII small subunit [Cyanobacteria bacterium]|nr:exodeoxyribonuclease VII small subunit [Cyanobacteriota bacterium]MDA1246054.1 exodeoxyribonuclease VII small subunit [Cyanobacteriota bacterium]